MYSIYDDRRRPARDMPPSSSARYYDTLYAQPSSRTAPRYAGLDPADPSSSSSAPYDRHHRRRGSVDESATRPSRRTPKVVASDDGWGSHDTPHHHRRSSRHDVETKNGEGHRRFREKRSGYEEDEAQNLRRAKSHSPRRAAREAEEPRRASPQAQAAPKSSWAATGDDYAAAAGAGAGLHRSATTGRKPRAEQYYDDDIPRVGRSKARDRGYEYSTAAPAVPRPSIGDYPPYRTTPPPTSSRDADEKLGGKQHRGHDARSRERGEKPYHSAAGVASAYSQYDPPIAPEPPRRGRHADDYPLSAQPSSSSQPAPRMRHHQHRAPPPDDYDDPYDRAAPPSRSARQQRQSVPPPQARSRYEDDYEQDPSDPPPRRRATSMSQGGPGRGAYDAGGRERRYYDERPGRSSTTAAGMGREGGGAASGAYDNKGREKGKKIGKQAGKLFMTHAFPVIKQEAVPFLTKAAQAYFEQKR